MNNTKLYTLLESFGASFVGFSDVSENLSKDLETLRFAITVGVRLSDFIIEQIQDSPTYTYFHHYRSVNTLIDQITLRGMLFLQEQGFSAFSVPASQTVNNGDGDYEGVFPHKTAAFKAGLGYIGKNGLFISNSFGPRVRLGTILTDMELPINIEKRNESCGSCKLCVESCPAMALTGNEWKVGMSRSEVVDAKACSEYMNKHFKHIGRGSVCGLCVKVCPKGKK